MANVYANLQDAIEQAVNTLAGPVKVGTWDDTGTVGSGIVLSATGNQFAELVAADDGGTALTAGWYAAAFDQFLLDTTFTDGRNVSAFGHCGELHLGVSVSGGGNYAGVFGYAEVETGKTLTNGANQSFSGVLAGIDVPSGAILATGTMAACIATGGNFGGTHTGKLAGIFFTNPSAGSYDYLFQIGSPVSDGTGAVETISGNATNQVKGIKIRIGATAYWIPCQNATS